MPAPNIVSLISAPVTPTPTYASRVDAAYNNNASNLVPLDQRFNTAANLLQNQNPAYYNVILQNAVHEFKRLHAGVKKWQDLTLAQSVYVTLAELFIDASMQRELSLPWVFKLLAKFKSTKVVPIQVYIDPETGKACAWDGQHTAVLLYFICVNILGLDPTKIKVPVNIFHSDKKSEMRECFLDLNSIDGKLPLDLIDHFRQHVLGVRIDGSNNPAWELAEKKQCILAKHNLFVTHEKFGDHTLPGAITRLQEINALDIETLDWVCRYLDLVTQGTRAVVEKEIVMMSKFFGYCRFAGIKPDDAYIQQIAYTNLQAFNADFSPKGMFWAQVADAYKNWHATQPTIGSNYSRVSKEPVHGIPFLVAQYHKDLPHLSMPRNIGTHPFWPSTRDLF